MKYDDGQFSLFSEDEIPDNIQTYEMAREVVAHHIKHWTDRSGITKKLANAIIDAAQAHINAEETPVEDIVTAFGEDGFLLSNKKLTPDEVSVSLELAPFYAQAETVLTRWSDRRSLSARSVLRSKVSVAEALRSGTEEGVLRYALSQRGLLASNRLLTPEVIQEALAGVTSDREAGVLSNKIFHKWYGEYYVGRSTQPIGQIMQVVKKALLDGLAPDIVERALELTGREGIPITENSLQYGTVKVRKEDELRERAGAFKEAANQEGIASRLFTKDTADAQRSDEERYKEMF